MTSSSLSSSTTRIHLVLNKRSNERSQESSEGEKEVTSVPKKANRKNQSSNATLDTGMAEISPTPHKSQAIPSQQAYPNQNSGSSSNEHQWTDSSANLPPLSAHTTEKLADGRLQFPINEECTSLRLAPSGRHLVAGFTDGTLRLFDLTETWDQDCAATISTSAGTLQNSSPASLFSSTSSDDDDDDDDDENQLSSAMVCSKSFQAFGAVCCQIQARGVHTSLQMHVDISEDSRFAFGGVTRGSMELVAVDLTAVEQHADLLRTRNNNNNNNILDYVQVHRHSEAKLKGFGACARLRGSPDESPKYLLLTGRGIKNLHIWCFSPDAPDRQRWQCLYDTPTNGNTISLLHLRYDPHGCLQAMTKSDGQKLRLWDLSYEQQDDHGPSVIAQFRKKEDTEERPKRPPYVDVASTESTLGIAGAFAFGGGDGIYNQMSVVGLDVDNVRSPYNRTELALPGNTQNRRQQRGDLKSIVRVAGMVMDAGHVLLELSDGSIVQYSQNSTNSVGLPRLHVLPSKSFGAPYRPDDPVTSRTLCVTRIASSGTVVAAAATSHHGHGSIVLRQLEQEGRAPIGFWGFDGASSAPVRKPVASNSPAVADKLALASCVQQTPRKEVPKSEGSRVVQLFPDGSVVTPKIPVDVTSGKSTTTLKVKKLLPQGKPPGSAARVSLSPSKDRAVGPEVSPEQGIPASEMKRMEERSTKKKNSAMMKYLREAGAKKKGKKKRKRESPMKNAGPGASTMVSSKALESTKKRKTSSPHVPRKLPGLRDGNATNKSTENSIRDVPEIMGAVPSSAHSPMRLTRAMRKEAGIDEDPRTYISVHYGRKIPTPLTRQLSSKTVHERFAVPVIGDQEAARMNLAAHHRAQHEMLRKKVFSSADRAVKALTRLPSISDAQAKKQLAETLEDYQELLHDMLGRQRMEASSLAAQQSWGAAAQVPELQVSFPFPECFETAKISLDLFIGSA